MSGQLIVPLAGSLASEDKRGQIVGTLASGILCGILLSRTISGLLADTFGWRAIYLIAAILSFLFAVVLFKKLPDETHDASIPYSRLLTSVVNVVLRYPAIQVTLLITACIFVVFSMFWTSITFLLSADPFHYNAAQIGLVGLLGFSGALAARNAGKLHDKGLSVSGTGGERKNRREKKKEREGKKENDAARKKGGDEAEEAEQNLEGVGAGR